MKSALFIVGALLAGIILGAVTGQSAPEFARLSSAFIEPLGTLWLHALQMTIIPLIIALLITGINAASSAARAGRVAARSVATFIIILWCSATFAALMMPLILQYFPAPAAASAALRTATGPGVAATAVPGFGDFINSLVPTNAIAAAANDQILPLILFTTVFAFAITRLPQEKRAPLTGFFDALASAMLVVIGWVLLLAPIGVFALGYAVAVKTGLAALGGLAHYVAAVSGIGIMATLIALLFGIWSARRGPMAYIRAIMPPQAVAISTQSSLACLPAMLKSSIALGVPAERADVTLPLAVALFRYTGPAMNLSVAIYVAHLFGIELSAPTLAAGVAVAATTTLASVSLPGTISFITSIAPIAAAMGVPIAPLAILVAVEQLPDIWRTVGNVMMDVAVTTNVNSAMKDGETVDAIS